MSSAGNAVPQQKKGGVGSFEVSLGDTITTHRNAMLDSTLSRQQSARKPVFPERLHVSCLRLTHKLFGVVGLQRRGRCIALAARSCLDERFWQIGIPLLCFPAGCSASCSALCVSPTMEMSEMNPKVSKTGVPNQRNDAESV